MDRPSKFDKAIKDKLEALEGEPSARVWSGVRAEIGVGTRKTSPVWFRVAAGAALLVVAGSAWYFLRPQTTPAGKDFTASSVQSTKRNWNTGKVVKQYDSVQTPVVQPDLASQQHKTLPVRQPQTQFVQAPQQPLQESPRPNQVPQEMFVQEDPTPQTNPRLELPAPTPEAEPAVVVSQESVGRKRSYRLPKADELTLASLREKSKGVLPTLAEGAENYLGVETDYQRKESEGESLTAFSMDLGLFKIKKVRTVK